MTDPVLVKKAGKHLHLLVICTLMGFIASCGSTRITPQYVDETPSAVVVDSSIPSDSSVEAYIQPYKIKLNRSMDSIIGYAEQELYKQEVESALGNFVADLTLDAARKVTDAPVDMGVLTIGGLRVPLPAGPIRLGDLYELMPFENMIVVLSLNGEQTWQLFEFAARKKITAISNSKMLVQDGKPVKVFIGGEPFDPAKTYTIATSDYLAGGGDNMEFLKQAELVNNTDILLRSAIVNKVASLQQAGKKVIAQVEGRVEVIE